MHSEASLPSSAISRIGKRSYRNAGFIIQTILLFLHLGYAASFTSLDYKRQHIKGFTFHCGRKEFKVPGVIRGIDHHTLFASQQRNSGDNQKPAAKKVRSAGNKSRNAQSKSGGLNKSQGPRKIGSRSSSTARNIDDSSGGEVRINKCLPGLSRRGADEAVAEGRVTVNGRPATSGMKISGKDVVRLDGKLQQWEGMASAKRVAPSSKLEDRSFMYLKYWKPVGVTCTSEKSDKSNIITAGRFDLFPQRVFTVGRLDKDSTGLILLTSDGRVNQALLRPSLKKEKHYTVEFDKVPTDAQISSLRDGVVITTEAQRPGAKPLTAKTRPCKVVRLAGGNGKSVEIVLTEGRNRQIRKMAEAVGLYVVRLHRTSFAGITLKGLTEGNWAELTEKEMGIIQEAVGRDESQGSSEGVDDDMD